MSRGLAGLLAAVGAAMFAIVGLTQGDWGLVMIADAGDAIGLELRPLTWSHVDLDGDPANEIPPSMMVWRSVRAGGDTKTRKSRRPVALPAWCVAVLREQLAQVAKFKAHAGNRWQENDLVFPSRVGNVADASHVRRSFRKVTAAAGLDPADWTPRSHGTASSRCCQMPVFRSRTLPSSSVTPARRSLSVYRKQIRPVITQGAEVMDRIFARNSQEAGGVPSDA